MKRTRVFLAAIIAALGASHSASADDDRRPDRERVYEVTITNITPGQTFTPILVATHSARIALFSLGEPASNELAILAEAGDTAPLASALASSGEVLDAQTIGGLLGPGGTASVRVKSKGRFDRLSVAAMLIPTNDSFFAVNSFDLPSHRERSTLTSVAYDAGSEPNDELCRNIPGPMCGGEGTSVNVDGEGFVHVSSGIHGAGDLAAPMYDWRNPVARITVRRID